MADCYVHNVGMADKCARTFLGAICLAVFFLTPLQSYLIAMVGIILIATAVLGTCPAYTVLGFNTAGVEKEAAVAKTAAKSPGAKRAKKRAKKRARKK